MPPVIEPRRCVKESAATGSRRPGGAWKRDWAKWTSSANIPRASRTHWLLQHGVQVGEQLLRALDLLRGAGAVGFLVAQGAEGGWGVDGANKSLIGPTMQPRVLDH